MGKIGYRRLLKDLGPTITLQIGALTNSEGKNQKSRVEALKMQNTCVHVCERD